MRLLTTGLALAIGVAALMACDGGDSAPEPGQHAASRAGESARGSPDTSGPTTKGQRRMNVGEGESGSAYERQVLASVAEQLPRLIETAPHNSTLGGVKLQTIRLRDTPHEYPGADRRRESTRSVQVMFSHANHAECVFGVSLAASPGSSADEDEEPAEAWAEVLVANFEEVVAAGANLARACATPDHEGIAWL